MWIDRVSFYVHANIPSDPRDIRVTDRSGPSPFWAAVIIKFRSSLISNNYNWRGLLYIHLLTLLRVII